MESDDAEKSALRPTAFTLAGGVLDRSSSVPLYHQLFLVLRERILGGEWKAGDVFPRDTDIEESFDVSRITVRKAMDRLVDENLVARYRGRGSFVTALPPHGEPSTTFGSSHSNRIEIVDVTHVPLSRQTADRLGMPNGANAGLVKRIHVVADAAICVEYVIIDDRLLPNGLSREELEPEGLDALYERAGIKIASYAQTVSAILPSFETADALKMQVSQPVLYVARTCFDSVGGPVDFRKMYYRGDRFILEDRIAL